jgi:hypothetical protein
MSGVGVGGVDGGDIARCCSTIVLRHPVGFGDIHLANYRMFIYG